MPIVVMSGQVAQKKKIYEYIYKLSKELGINRMHKKVLLVNFVTSCDDQAEGSCWGDMKDGYAEILIARTSCGDKMSHESMMQTLAHEMVHAKQYFRKELCGYSMSWKGKKPRNYKYENAPWEKEAFAKEEELWKKCW